MTVERDYIRASEISIDHYQYDLAAVQVSIAQAQAMQRQAAALERIAAALELVAGKRGIVYTRDASGV